LGGLAAREGNGGVRLPLRSGVVDRIVGNTGDDLLIVGMTSNDAALMGA
jgi:hypothetical protein